MNISFTYYDCQSCTERTHCDDCGEVIKGKLLQLDGVEAVDINMAAKRMTITTDLDIDDLEEPLEDMSVFIA